MTCANGAPPLGLAWENVTVSEDGQAVSRGIALAIGNPQQVISLRPSVADANTWVFNSADCVSSKNDSCIGQAGGVLDRQPSTSFRLTTEAAWNGTHDQAISEGSFIFFNDDIRFGSNGSSAGFPLYMDQPGWGTQSGLGIGPGSTFLSAAVSSGSAPSTAWGLWVGSRSIANPADGGLWIGGYDTSRVNGEFTEFNTFDDCLTCVTITNITYITPTGSTSLFSNSTKTLSVALKPFTRTLNVPEDIFLNFAAASNGIVGTDPGTTGLLTFPPTHVFGNLSVTLKNGYTTLIPAQEFFFPPRKFNKQGQYAIANDSYILAALANVTVEPGYLLDWGVPYLTMNYMIMDAEQKSFKMAPAVQGPYGYSNGPLVQPLCSGIAPVTTSAATPSATAPAPPATSSATPTHHSSTNVGAIAGGVVGGVVGLAIIALLLFYVLRSRKREKAARDERDAAVAETAKGERSSTYTGTASPTEVSEAPNNPNINHWLYAQPKAEDPAPPSATMNRPFEMPANSL